MGHIAFQASLECEDSPGVQSARLYAPLRATTCEDASIMLSLCWACWATITALWFSHVEGALSRGLPRAKLGEACQGNAKEECSSTLEETVVCGIKSSTQGPSNVNSVESRGRLDVDGIEKRSWKMGRLNWTGSTESIHPRQLQ